MIRGINAEDLEVGDAIRTSLGICGTVLGCLGYQHREQKLAFRLDSMSDIVYLRVLEIVELRRRPSSIRELDALGRIYRLAEMLGRIEVRPYKREAEGCSIQNLRNAIDVWELMKSERDR